MAVELEVEFVEIYQGQPLFSDILEFFRNAGFEFSDFVTGYRYGRQALDRTGQLAFADALFLRLPEFVYRNYKGSQDKLDNYRAIVEKYGKTDLAVALENYLGMDIKASSNR